MMMGFGFLGMMLFWGILLVLVAGGVIWAFQWGSGARRSDGKHQPTARQVLDARFARGEVSSEEYETIRTRIER